MAGAEYEEAEKSLNRVQNFDASALSRVDALGTELNFLDAVPHAEKIITLFQQFPTQYLKDLPPRQAQILQSQADAAYSIFETILKFDPKQGDAYAQRTNLIENLKTQFEPIFTQIMGLISYGSSRMHDFSAIEREARAAAQAAKDRADEAAKGLEEQQAEAQRILEEVRRVAAEQGVSKQATYFREEGASHETQAENWRWWTIYSAIGLGLYAAISATFHRWPLLSPTGPYDAFQLGLSKILIFGVIAYMLFLCAKNFLAHKHNAIVNRHRYNALLTFNALADAANGPENRDIVLTHASGCIFAPQETGYTKGNPHESTAIIQALPRVLSPSGTSN